MRPATYGRLVELLARRCRVVVPDLFAVRGRWRPAEITEALSASLDHLGLDRVSLLGHSFGGGIELAWAARWPHRVVEMVFSDTLAASREWGLAGEAVRHPGRFLEMATPAAVSAFAWNWARHPRQLVNAAWWAFTSGREADCVAVVEAGITSHVLWANRDSILPRADGLRFAGELGATFSVASAADGRIMDHDWMFQQPDVFVDHLDGLGLAALNRSAGGAGRGSRNGHRAGPTRPVASNGRRQPVSGAGTTTS
jgi:pimeloyl-ACP methyl ester carboxylesterase